MDQLELCDRYKQYSTADLINIVREKDKGGEEGAATARVDSYKAAVADWVEPLARPSAEGVIFVLFALYSMVKGLPSRLTGKPLSFLRRFGLIAPARP